MYGGSDDNALVNESHEVGTRISEHHLVERRVVRMMEDMVGDTLHT